MRRFGLLICFAVLSALVLAQSGPAAAAPPPDGQIDDVGMHPGAVQFLFSAGNLPDGTHLDPHSIVVTAGGQTLGASASPANTAAAPGQTILREVVLALDVSGSMAGEGIAAARAAALSYAHKLPPDVRVGLVTFANRPNVVLPPTIDRAALATALGHVSAGGNTALYDGVVTAAEMMSNLPAGADRRLLILSDGADTSSTHDIADVTSAIVKGHVAVDVVAFRLPGDQHGLDQIAAASQGQVLPASNADGLAKSFSTAAQAFRQQVLVTVTVPTAVAGKTTDLKVSIRAGDQSVSAQTQLTFPEAPASVTTPSASMPSTTESGANSPRRTESHLALWVTIVVSFLAMLAVGLLALLMPVLRHERAQKNARIAETMRYRVVGVAGVAPDATVPAPKGKTRSALTERTLSIVDRTVRARGWRERIVSDLDRAGLRMRPEEWATIQLLTIVIPSVALALLAGSPLFLPVGGVLGWLGARFFVKHKMSRRADEFERQLPDTLQLLAGSLRTGFSLNQALTSVVREGTEPTASEFARALTEVRLGAELEDALDDVATRMTCQDLHWVVIAIRISREVGGNLAEVLGTTASLMRERATLRGVVRVLSAEGRISARVLVGLPFVIAGFLALFRPGYLEPLFNSAIGIALLGLGAGLLVLGTIWLNRLVKIEV